MATSVREPAYVRTHSRSPAHDIYRFLLSLYAPAVETGGCHRGWAGQLLWPRSDRATAVVASAL